MNKFLFFLLLDLMFNPCHANPLCNTNSDSEKVRTGLNIEARTCERLKASQTCQDTYKEIQKSGNKLSDYELDCSKPQGIVESLTSNPLLFSGCAAGVWNETFGDFGTFIGETAAKMHISSEESKQLQEKCNSNFTYKKQYYKIFADVYPRYLKSQMSLSEEQLQKLDCNQIAQKMTAPQKFAKIHSEFGKVIELETKRNLSKEETEFKSWYQGHYQSNAPLKNLDLSSVPLKIFSIAKNSLANIGIQVDCYNPKKAMGIICETITDTALLAAPAWSAARAIKMKKRAGMSVVAENKVGPNIAADTITEQQARAKSVASESTDSARTSSLSEAELKQFSSRTKEIKDLKANGINVANADLYLSGKENFAVLDGDPKGTNLGRLIYEIQRKGAKPKILLDPVQLDGSLGLAVGGDAIYLDTHRLIENPSLMEGVLLHEAKHISTYSKKHLDRGISFYSADEKLKVPGYEKGFRTDELEARVSELAKYKLDRNKNFSIDNIGHETDAAFDCKLLIAEQSKLLKMVKAGQGEVVNTWVKKGNINLTYYVKEQNLFMIFPVGRTLRTQKGYERIMTDLVQTRLERLKTIENRLAREYPIIFKPN